MLPQTVTPHPTQPMQKIPLAKTVRSRRTSATKSGGKFHSVGALALETDFLKCRGGSRRSRRSGGPMDRTLEILQVLGDKNTAKSGPELRLILMDIFFGFAGSLDRLREFDSAKVRLVLLSMKARERKALFAQLAEITAGIDGAQLMFTAVAAQLRGADESAELALFGPQPPLAAKPPRRSHGRATTKRDSPLA